MTALFSADNRPAMTDRDPELDRLQALLDAMAPEERGMSVATLDGYITALVVCPAAIPPPEWLSGIRGEGRAFVHTAEAGAQDAAVLGHYNRVARVLAACPEEYSPVMELDPDTGKVLWEPWIDGFARAMRLRPGLWEQFARRRDEEASASIGMMGALTAFRHERPALTAAAVQVLDRLAPAMIPDLVRSLSAWRRGQPFTEQGAEETGFMP